MARASKTGGKKTGAKARGTASGRGRKTARSARRPAAPKSKVTKAGKGANKGTKGESLASVQAELARRTAELEAALQHQAASSDVLEVINASPGDLTPVFEVVLDKAMQLCGAPFGGMWVIEGDLARSGATRNVRRPYLDFIMRQRIPHAEAFGRNIRDRPFVHVPDMAATEAYRRRVPVTVASVELGGMRSYLAVPLREGNTLIGVLSLYRDEVLPFDDAEIALVRGFAAQAEIAMKNARLFNETQEALERQTATADVLKVISRSTFDLQAVFDTLVRSAARLCEAESAFIFRHDGEVYRLQSSVGFRDDFRDFMARHPIEAGTGTLVGKTALTRDIVHIPDVLLDPDYSWTESRERGGYRTMLGVPLLREGTPVGVLAMTRDEPRPFSAKQIELVQTFADQAVIAIENVRLFDEVEARTEDLQESLRQQTATANVLKVISRSAFDLEPALVAICETAVRLCDADQSAIYTREGDLYRFSAAFGFPPAYEAAWRAAGALPVNPSSPLPGTRCIAERRPVHVLDITAEPGYHETRSRTSEARTALGIPLLRDGEPVGNLVLNRRRVEAFTDRQIEIMQTFADQAVIAIENARLFNEVQARTRDLTESLQQQTATAEVLKVISRSAFDLQTVFDALIGSAVDLVGALNGTICLRDGNGYRYLATSGIGSEFGRFLAEHPPKPGRASAAGRVILSGRVESIPDVLEDHEYIVPALDLNRTRSVLGVPLLRDDRVEGALVLARAEPGRFKQQQIDIVQTFADQAVIAIENARLFDEVQAKTRELEAALQQQTATADVLKVISRSAFDLDTVLTTLAESARAQCRATGTYIVMREGDELRFRVIAGEISDEFADMLRAARLKVRADTLTGRAVATGEIVHIADVPNDTTLRWGAERQLGEFGSGLSVPLILDGERLGAFVIGHREINAFTPDMIELVKTFADQAIIAIKNTRLFEQVQARTRELAQSLDDLRAAQDRLVQTEKLASLGQLTAGIAHEIKNPLNFVNNFAALSAELTDELQDALKPAALDATIRGEVDEITSLLKDNLGKVVQHGQRADSIVKNMLLHSREGSGDHRPTDINALVDESLNLAYHGARAEKPQFNVTLRRDFDPGAGTVEVFPQEITRVFLNLISNSFYAVARRSDANDAGFEPTLSARTRDCGQHVEIRIRDNGTGIPPEVKEKMFNPFFTTKPAGEGTGLGLSMSHDIIVKQHGGTIDVETQPGEFTEFTIRLPRQSRFRSEG